MPPRTLYTERGCARRYQPVGLRQTDLPAVFLNFFARSTGNRDSRDCEGLSFRQGPPLSGVSLIGRLCEFVPGSLRLLSERALSMISCSVGAPVRSHSRISSRLPVVCLRRFAPGPDSLSVYITVVTPSYVKGRIEAGLDERQLGHGHKSRLIDEVFRQDSVPSGNGEDKMPSDRFLPALKKLGISVDEGEAQAFLRTKGGARAFVDPDEFRRAATKKWCVDAWAQSLPLAQMLVDALPQSTGCNRLRAVCSLTEEDIRVIADGYRDGLQRLLRQHQVQLRAAYEALDKLVATPNGAARKFELPAMSCGSIQDFHAGLQKRIGEAVTCFLDGS